MEMTVTFDGTSEDNGKAFDFARWIYKYTEDVVVSYNDNNQKWEVLITFDEDTLPNKKEEKRIKKYVKSLHGEIEID